MKARLGVMFLAAGVVLSFGLLCSDASEPGLPSFISVPNASARLAELTATVKLTNEGTADVRKYVFRLTTPPGDLPYQRARSLALHPEVTRKAHKNGLDSYIELRLAIPASGTVTKEFRFLLLLLPVDYLRMTKLPVSEADKRTATNYLQSVSLIESDAPQVKKMAESLFPSGASDLEKAKAAYEYPAHVLKYRVQKPAGAVKALQTGIGDCTEYSCLFCALCRAGGVPARRVAVFNLGSKNEITTEEPNHDTAEVFLSTHGWVPVDPNVGGGKYDRPVGFARASNTQIVLKRDNAWVWSTFLPPDGVATTMPKPTVKTTVSWHCKVVQEGDGIRLLKDFAKGE